MKLSEFETGKAFDVILDIMPSVVNIVGDEDLKQHYARLAKTKMQDVQTMAQKILFMTNSICEVSAILLKTHREDVFFILASINCKTVDEIRKQKFAVTLQQISEALKDEELVQLFRSQGQTGDAKSSGSASAKPVDN